LRYARGLAIDSEGNLVIADTENHVIRSVSPTGLVSIVAGSGTPGFNGDGETATTADLARPRAVAVDATGALYIADSLNHRIRKVGPGALAGRLITTVAGNGTAAFSGDGSAATAAGLAEPSGIVVDAAGNLFIADTRNHRVRRVTTTGIISTVAGVGIAGFSGDGGPAVSAQLADPAALAMDSAGNLFVADSGNNVIRKITPLGVISTVAGTGSQGFSGDGGPATSAELSLVGSSDSLTAGLAVDAGGSIYIADTGSHRIRMVSPRGIITTIAGSGIRGFGGDGGQPISAQFFNPSGLAIDSTGNLFISDTFNSRVRKITSLSETTFSIAGRGAAVLHSSRTLPGIASPRATRLNS
jgi:sugar lactone lactonase YvrE